MSAKVPLTFGPTAGPCTVCGLPGRACGQCRVDFYCGKEHQEQDRPRHRKGCGSMVVQRSPQLGRYVVAKRDIPAGTLLMRELPLAVVPKPRSPADRAICVGCFRVLAEGEVRDCARCGWPVCGEPCSLRAGHRAECAAFQRAGFRMTDVWNQDLTVWHALAALRVVLADEPESAALGTLQAELPTPIPEDMADPVVRSLLLSSRSECDRLTRCAVGWLERTARVVWLDRDALRRGVMAMLVNALDVEACADYAAAGLYKGLSLLEHACVANAVSDSWRDDDLVGVPDGLQRVVLTTRDVLRGEHLSLAYLSDPLQGRGERRLTLMRWGFVCRCALCEDPTPCGLHLHGWYCGRCRRQGRRSLVTQGADDRFQCGDCGWRAARPEASMPQLSQCGPWPQPAGDSDDEGDDGSGRAEAFAMERRLLAPFGPLGLFDSKLPLQEMEGLLQEASAVLHPTHHAVLGVKKALIYYKPCFKDGLGEARLLAGYCRDLLAAGDALAAGDSRLRAAPLLRLVHLCLDQLKAIAADVRARPRLWPDYKEQAKVLTMEIVGLLLELKKSSVVPYKKRLAEHFQKILNTVRKDLPA